MSKQIQTRRATREDDAVMPDIESENDNEYEDEEPVKAAPKPKKAPAKASRSQPPTILFESLTMDDSIPDGAVAGKVKKAKESEKWANKMKEIGGNPTYQEVFGIPGPRKEANVPQHPKDNETFVKAFASVMSDYILIGRKNDKLQQLTFSRPGEDASNPSATFHKFWREEFYLKSQLDGNDDLAKIWGNPLTKKDDIICWSTGWKNMLKEYNEYLNQRQESSRMSKDSKLDYFTISKEKNDSAVSKRK